MVGVLAQEEPSCKAAIPRPKPPEKRDQSPPGVDAVPDSVGLVLYDATARGDPAVELTGVRAPIDPRDTVSISESSESDPRPPWCCWGWWC